MQKWLAVAVIGMFGMVPAAVWAQSNHNNMTGTGSGVGATVQQGRNNSLNSNSATGGQGGRGGLAIQGQRQDQGQVNQPQQTIGGDSYSVESPRQAPPAIAPNLTAVPETCMGSAAVGASTPFGGVSFGSTYKSEDCELRMYARALMALGKNDAALALLAQNEKVAAALRATGTKAAWLKEEKDQTPAPVAAQGLSPAVPRMADTTQSP